MAAHSAGKLDEGPRPRNPPIEGMMTRCLSIAALLLALAAAAAAREYDAESDVGLVAEDPSPAVAAR